MAYRNDPDLEFLAQCDNEDLEVLVHYLTKDKNGELRLTEELTSTDEYQRHHPNHQLYWRQIAAELQCYGANTIATLFRGGEGVVYREVLCDVASKLKVNYNPQSPVHLIEMNLLLKLLTDSLEGMSEEQRRALLDSLQIGNVRDFALPSIAMALQAAVAAGGFAAYQVAVIVANAVAKQLLGRGLAFAANQGLTRAIGAFAGPVGWAISAALTLHAIAGPAYRVTIPAVVQVAFMRAKMNAP